MNNRASEAICLAREYRMMSQGHLAELMNISQGQLSKIERGILVPSEQIIASAAQHLAFPPKFFQEETNESGLPAYLFFRRRLSLTQQFLRAVAAQVKITKSHIRKLMQAFDMDKPAFRGVRVSDFGGSIEAVAQKFRRILAIDRGPITNLTEVVERAGIIIIPCDFGTDQIDGISVNETDLPPLIFMRDSMPGDRWRWTLAHEFAHTILHSDHYIPGPEVDDEADRFAGEFMMPASDISSHFLSKLTLQKAASLKLHWKVSMQSLIMRAGHLERITESQKRRLMMRLSQLGYRKNEPNPIEREHPKLLEELFTYYMNELGYNVPELCMALRISQNDLHRMYPGVILKQPTPQPKLKLL